MVDEWVSLREFARRMGVQVSAVQSALANGRIVRRDEDKKIHWPTQSKAWNSFRDPSKVRDNAERKRRDEEFRAVQEVRNEIDPDDEDDDSDEESDGDGGNRYHRAKTKKEIAVAGLKEIELKEAKGLLVKSSAVRAAMAQFSIDVRDRIMTIPERVTNELSAEVAARKGNLQIEEIREIVNRLWTRESRKVLEEIASAGH